MLSGMRFPRNRKNIREGYTLAFWNWREYDPPTTYPNRISQVFSFNLINNANDNASVRSRVNNSPRQSTDC